MTPGPLELLIILILVGLPTLLVVSLVRRGNSRPCPRCGSRVRNGRLDCKTCGFDFNQVGA